MSEETDVRDVANRERINRILIYAAVLVLVFLLGLVPMAVISYSRASERDEARRELSSCKIEMALASAAIDARLGNYEPARLAASNFFTELRAELDKDGYSIFDQTQRENLKTLLSSRDELITLLARSDPAAADRLSNMFVMFRKHLGKAA